MQTRGGSQEPAQGHPIHYRRAKARLEGIPGTPRKTQPLSRQPKPSAVFHGDKVKDTQSPSTCQAARENIPKIFSRARPPGRLSRPTRGQGLAFGQAGVEPATSWSRTKRATICATARNGKANAPQPKNSESLRQRRPGSAGWPPLLPRHWLRSRRLASGSVRERRGLNPRSPA